MISPLEDEIEQYVFNRWEFAICNTFFAVTTYSAKLSSKMTVEITLNI